ncbi:MULTISPECIES: type VII secretion protein EccB [unclassified Streptomyces]|uniref:Type VII secretion protein EccB n=1 Tax=Streptomyces sp. NBC_00060 TaxID=2975636 RepID=A0AAU2HAN6_9ACTN
MQSRRDQVQAHMFVMGRVAAGMYRDDPDAPEPPHRRTSRGMGVGLAIGVLVALAVTVYGFVVPGGSDGWKKEGTLVLDKQSGARYLSLDGRLHPVLNQSSARLLAGDRLSVKSLSSASIAAAPRGPALGIVGAPDALPAASRLSRDAWSACATRAEPGGDGALLTLGVGLSAGGRPVTAGRAVLVRGGTRHDTYLLWHGTRSRVDPANGAPAALGYGDTPAFPVPEGFLNALPPGPDLATPEVAGRGAQGPSLAGRPSRVGQLFGDGAGHHLLLRSDGLAPLTPLQYALLKGDPRTQRTAYAGAAVTEAPVGPDDLARHRAPGTAASSPGPGLPDDVPRVMEVEAGEAVCAVTATGAGGPSVSVVLPQVSAVAGTPPAAGPGLVADARTADRVALRAGSGALVRAVSSSGTGRALYLVTESGAKYPVADADSLQQLGYPAASAVALPTALLSMLPTGPALDVGALRSRGLVVAAAENGGK